MLFIARFSFIFHEINTLEIEGTALTLWFKFFENY